MGKAGGAGYATATSDPKRQLICFSSEALLCLGCGRRWPGGESPRPVIAA